MAQPQEFTVFLASPSADTLDAREAVAEAVKAINIDPGYAPRVRLTLLRWDDPDRTLALSAEGEARKTVNSCCCAMAGIARMVCSQAAGASSARSARSCWRCTTRRS